MENVLDVAGRPMAWDSILNTGMGKPAMDTLWITSYLNLTTLLSKINFSWEMIVFWFWLLPAVILSFLSGYWMCRYLSLNKKYSFIGGLIYLSNTYILLILTGGQIGVSLAYSIAPLVLLCFIKLTDNVRLRVYAGLILALQILFDPRITFITGFAIGLFFLIKGYRELIKIIIPVIIVGLLHSYWIMPLLISRATSIPLGVENISQLAFFSFADLSNSLALLHPNWPENIFGKVYFMRPEFIILPIIAYGSLLFLKNSKSEARNSKQILNSKLQIQNTIVLFFVFLGLVGAFLGKGVNEPFGFIYEWLFQYMPGFKMFRDPTKFYLLIALSYSVLIPFTLNKIGNLIKHKRLPVLLFLVFWIWLIKPVWIKEISGIFRPSDVPKEYVELKDFLYDQKDYFRTLWIPIKQRFGFFSSNHPAIDGDDKFLQKNFNLADLQDMSVKYVVVPYDSGGELFVKDYKYDESKYQEAVVILRNTSWLKQVNNFGKIAVFEVPQYKDHFWTENNCGNLTYKYQNPTKYSVNIKTVNSCLFIFSEAYDKHWLAQGFGQEKIYSQQYKNKLNSFFINKAGEYTLTVEYEPQKYVNYGLIISVVTVIISLIYLVIDRRK